MVEFPLGPDGRPDVTLGQPLSIISQTVMSARHVFAEAEHMATSGYDRLISLAGRITEQLPGNHVTALQRSSIRMEVVSVLQQFQRAVGLLLDLHGSSAFALGNLWQRFWRDLNVGARHAQMSTYLATANHGLLVTGAGGPLLMD